MAESAASLRGIEPSLGASSFFEKERRGLEGSPMRVYRDIATLVGAQVVCFLLLSHLEPAFFLLHFYQTIIYLAILIMLFYTEDRWAYRIGIVAPAGWLAMTFATGFLWAFTPPIVLGES